LWEGAEGTHHGHACLQRMHKHLFNERSHIGAAQIVHTQQSHHSKHGRTIQAMPPKPDHRFTAHKLFASLLPVATFKRVGTGTHTYSYTRALAPHGPAAHNMKHTSTNTFLTPGYTHTQTHTHTTCTNIQPHRVAEMCCMQRMTPWSQQHGDRLFELLVHSMHSSHGIPHSFLTHSPDRRSMMGLRVTPYA
jgi:hypothetical protein